MLSACALPTAETKTSNLIEKPRRPLVLSISSTCHFGSFASYARLPARACRPTSDSRFATKGEPQPSHKTTGAFELSARERVRRDGGVTSVSLLLGLHGHVSLFALMVRLVPQPRGGLTWCGKENPGQTRWTQTGCSSSQRQLSLPWSSFGICRARFLLRPRLPRRQPQRRRSRNSSRTPNVSS